MKIVFKYLFLSLLISIAGGGISFSQHVYHNPAEINEALNQLNRTYPGLTRLETIGKTYSGMDIKALVIGSGNRDSKPGIAVIGGIDGRYIAGREIALGFAAKLLENSGEEETRELLDRVSFYVIPDASPDASAAYFSAPVYEKIVNDNPTDNDRDFNIDEDPYEDINNDGYITLMRVYDVTGDYVPDPDDERIMRKADPSKGEAGQWFIYTEGIDNDKDGLFNEDSKGGVNFNNNFSFEYEEFGKYSGIHAVSDKEPLAIADYLYDHFNIFAVFSFGPQDNLGQAFKPGRQAQSGQQSSEDQQQWRRRSRKVTTIFPEDSEHNVLLSEKYLEITGYQGSPGFGRENGNFMEWAYYHYGRYSYSTPGWWVKPEKGMSSELSFLKYASENPDEEVFIDWKEVDHPDFPGKKVEVGGIRPFVMYNPPENLLEEVIESNYRFLVYAAKLHPELELINLTTEKIDKNLHRVKVTLHNKGVLGTMSRMGEDVKWVRKLRVEIKSDSGFNLVSGKRISVDDRLKGGETREYSWLIMGDGTFRISAGAVNCGTDEISFTLR